MGMTPDGFFEAFVRSNYEDFKQYPGCVRRAFNAAVSASHLADHYFYYFKGHNPSKISGFKGLGEFREHLSEETDGCFRDIQSISNAYKHLYTKGVYSSVSSTGAIECIEFADENAEVRKVEEEENKASKDNNFGSKVIFTRKDGKKLEFLATLDRVIQYWDIKLQ